MALLTDRQVVRRLASVPGWKHRGNAIVKTYAFRKYLDGIAFVNRVALLAESQNHHPDMTVGWRNVKLSLTTHDSGGLTKRDFRLAAAIDAKRSRAGQAAGRRP